MKELDRKAAAKAAENALGDLSKMRDAVMHGLSEAGFEEDTSNLASSQLKKRSGYRRSDFSAWWCIDEALAYLSLVEEHLQGAERCFGEGISSNDNSNSNSSKETE